MITQISDRGRERRKVYVNPSIIPFRHYSMKQILSIETYIKKKEKNNIREETTNKQAVTLKGERALEMKIYIKKRN